MLSRTVGGMLKDRNPLGTQQANRTLFDQPAQARNFVPPQLNTVKDSSAWRANPTALTINQQRGMFN